MNTLTAFEDFCQSLELLGQPKERCTEVLEMLNDAIKECLGFFSDGNVKRRQVNLYPNEVLAAQHFLNQYGMYLKRIRSGYDKIATKQAYGVFPNWK